MEITNLGLHLDYPAGEVVRCDTLKDVTCGMNPAYFRRYDDYLLVSSSASAIIKNGDDFKRNPDFKPPNWLDTPGEHDSSMVNNPISWIMDKLDGTSIPNWYANWQTADKRVFKLRPHETVSSDSSQIDFDPSHSIKDKFVLAERAAEAMKSFIQRIESNYPEAHHLVFTGGLDSQLIHLVPKIDPNKWHIFSGDPNYSIVKEWLKDNDIKFGEMYRGTSENRETLEMVREKIIASDLYANPRHIRWRSDLRDIVETFEDPLILWAGTEGDTYFSYHPDYQGKNRETFWRLQHSRAPSWQGTTNQTNFNMMNCPQLSPYHSPEMLELYQDYDPGIINEGDDIRKIIAQHLTDGESIDWPKDSPSPPPLAYERGLDTNAMYFNHLYRQ